MRGLLKLMKNEFRKLKRKMFVQLVLAASFLFPIPLTAIIYYLNTAQDKYGTKIEAFDALWQSVIGFGMLLLLPCILGIVAALLFFMERDNDTFKNLRVIRVRPMGNGSYGRIFIYGNIKKFLLVFSIFFKILTVLVTKGAIRCFRK